MPLPHGADDSVSIRRVKAMPYPAPLPLPLPVPPAMPPVPPEVEGLDLASTGLISIEEEMSNQQLNFTVRSPSAYPPRRINAMIS